MPHALCLAVSVLLATAPTPASAPKEAQKIDSHQAPYPAFGSIERLDPALDALIPKDAKLESVAEGFDWAEGPVWVRRGGYLLFSDVPRNTIYKWQEGKGVTVFMH